MNQTPNYALNQWEASDQLRRVDVNADNAKIDAALATKATAAALAALTARVTALENKSRFTKLKEFVSTESSSFLEIYLNDINWSQWDKVHVDILANRSGNYFFYDTDSTSVNDHKGNISCSSSQGIWSPRMTFHVGFQSNRLVEVSCGSNYNIFGMTYPQAVKMVFSGTTMGPGARYVFWGEK